MVKIARAPRDPARSQSKPRLCRASDPHPPVEKTSMQEIRAALDVLIGHSPAIDDDEEADHLRGKH